MPIPSVSIEANPGLIDRVVTFLAHLGFAALCLVVLYRYYAHGALPLPTPPATVVNINHAPAPEPPAAPAPEGSLAAPVRAFRDGLPASFAALADQAEAGRFKGTIDVSSSAWDIVTPLVSELNKAAARHSGPGGAITDAAGLRAEFIRAAESLKGK